VSIFVDDEILRKVARIIAGEEAIKIVMALKELKAATDDQILSHITKNTETELKLNDVRKMLFKLYNNSIVQCDGLRDETTGWFIFRWRLQLDQVEGFIKNKKKRILNILKTRLQYEEEYDFYYCNTPGCNRLTFEDAMEYIFKCPTCGKLLSYFDNSKIVNVLKEKINQLENKLSE
jgi:transcription initiation factor TFIIE subunit alpha